MGSRWKMPTKDQVAELLSKTYRTFVTLNGVNGIKLSLKTDSTKYIFFPATGYWSDRFFSKESTVGYYWTTTLYNTNTGYSWSMYLSEDLMNYNHDYNRTDGLAVRPVKQLSVRAISQSSYKKKRPSSFELSLL